MQLNLALDGSVFKLSILLLSLLLHITISYNTEKQLWQKDKNKTRPFNHIVPECYKLYYHTAGLPSPFLFYLNPVI